MEAEEYDLSLNAVTTVEGRWLAPVTEVDETNKIQISHISKYSFKTIYK